MQQQEELIEDEEEQEQKEEDARRAKREADELEAQMAQNLLPDSELMPEKLGEENARMTSEQLKELSEALYILSAKSSVLKERDELRALMEENLQAEEVCEFCLVLSVLMAVFRIPNHRQAPLRSGSVVCSRRLTRSFRNTILVLEVHCR